MSLICVETRAYPKAGQPLWGVTIDNNNFMGVSNKAIECIPKKERRRAVCSKGKGLNIHHATSRRDRHNFYSFSDFLVEDFAFSISMRIAKKYLPNTLKELAPSESASRSH
jgi:hypothetical protein